jgi:N-methylhydantoinase B/oxoprolinase/acetone carboxylase alpha subunit
MYYVEQTDPRFGARGRDGGDRGAPGFCEIRRADGAVERAPGKDYLVLRRGDVITLAGSGGGGFGAAG